MKQLKIDNGQLGGSIQMVMQSMFIFNFLTFLTNMALFYNQFLKEIIPLGAGVLLGIMGIVCWWATYYFMIYPSIIRFANRQSYAHGNPIKEEFILINKKLGVIMDDLGIEEVN